MNDRLIIVSILFPVYAAMIILFSDPMKIALSLLGAWVLPYYTTKWALRDI